MIALGSDIILPYSEEYLVKLETSLTSHKCYPFLNSQVAQTCSFSPTITMVSIPLVYTLLFSGVTAAVLRHIKIEST